MKKRGFMKKIFCATILCLFLQGCSNFNPRNNPRIENQDGKIEDIKTNQNGLMLELAKIRQQGEVTNSNLKEIQTGLVNLNATLSRNENYGVQILQGDGSLMLVFSLCVIGMIIFYYRNMAKKAEQAVKVMAREVARINDADLNDNIIISAKKFKVEKLVLEKMNEEI